MEQFERLRGRLRAIEEIGARRGQSAPGDRAARAFGEDIGAAHRAEVGNEPVEAGITGRHAVDFDDGLDEPDRGEQGGERRPVDARVAMRRCTTIGAVGSEHRAAQAREAATADDGAEQQPTGTEHVPQRKGRGLNVVGRFQVTDRQTQVDVGECGRLAFANGDAGPDRRQSVAPAPIGVTEDGRAFERDPNVGQPVETIVERALVEKKITAKAGGALPPEAAGMIVEQWSFHGALVQGHAGGNKGA